jgi:hypothetical protein
MKLGRPFIVRAPTPAITPTAEELVWWREASKPERRRIFYVWMPWYLGAMTLPAIIHDPAGFFGGKWKHVVPLTILAGLIAASLLWKTTSPGLLRRHLAGKRMRDALLASGDRPTDAPPGREAR